MKTRFLFSLLLFCFFFNNSCQSSVDSKLNSTGEKKEEYEEYDIVCKDQKRSIIAIGGVYNKKAENNNFLSFGVQTYEAEDPSLFVKIKKENRQKNHLLIHLKKGTKLEKEVILRKRFHIRVLYGSLEKVEEVDEFHFLLNFSVCGIIDEEEYNLSIFDVSFENGQRSQEAVEDSISIKELKEKRGTEFLHSPYFYIYYQESI